MDISLHTGPMGDTQGLTVYWFDQNGVEQKTRIDVAILNCDKPRVLSVSIDGEIVKLIAPKVGPVTTIKPGEWAKVK